MSPLAHKVQGVAALAAFTLLFITSTVAATSTPDSLEIKSVRFNSGRTTAAAVWSGTDVVVFGGWTSTTPTDQIVTYNPERDTVEVKASKLPLGRSALAAVWAGEVAYVFGGWNGLQSNEIIRYDPVADQLTVLDTPIPGGRAEVSAVWTGNAAYLFGGSDGTSTDKILRFTPSPEVIVPMEARLPSAREGTSAVWTGSAAYIFGGTNGGTEILKFDPVADEITIMEAELPSGRHRTAAVWDGRHAYIFAGEPATDEILRYDPAADELEVLELKLPTARSGVSAAWTGDRAFIVNGCCVGSTTYLSEILEFETANRAPIPLFSWTADGLDVTVNATRALDPDGAIVAYSWLWGDGQSTLDGPLNAHRYAGSGNVAITLFVTDERGLTSRVSSNVTLVASAHSDGSAIGGAQPGDDDYQDSDYDNVDFGDPPPSDGSDPGQNPSDVGGSTGQNDPTRTTNPTRRTGNSAGVSASASPSAGQQTRDTLTRLPDGNQSQPTFGEDPMNPKKTPGLSLLGAEVAAALALAVFARRRFAH